MAAWLKLEVSSKQWPCHGGVSDTVTPLGGGVFFGGKRRSLLWEASRGQAGSGLGLETGRGMVSCLPLASERQLFAGP